MVVYCTRKREDFEGRQREVLEIYAGLQRAMQQNSTRFPYAAFRPNCVCCIVEMASEAENRVSDGMAFSDGYGLRIEYAGKQNIVFQLNVVVQMIYHFFRQRVKLRPASASSFGGWKLSVSSLSRAMARSCSSCSCIITLMGIAAPRPDTLINHRKQHPFLFHRMHQQFVLHIGKQPGNFSRSGKVSAWTWATF